MNSTKIMAETVLIEQNTELSLQGPRRRTGISENEISVRTPDLVSV